VVEIRTARLRLRHATAAGLTPISTILSNPRATTYWSSQPHESLEQSHE
jgi:RimJ/RimL family protein N-acetyltransferase